MGQLPRKVPRCDSPPLADLLVGGVIPWVCCWCLTWDGQMARLQYLQKS